MRAALNRSGAGPMPVAVLIGLVLLLCLATVPLAGGRLSALADVRFGAPWLALAAIAVQIVVISIVPQGAGWVHHAAHLASYGLIAAFLWVNRRVPFLWLAAIGGGLNLVAITANGGVMPADPDALAAAGVEQKAGDFANSTAVAHPHLGFLGDVLAVPASWPVSNVFSVGDVILVIAALLALHSLCGSRLALRRSAARGGRESDRAPRTRRDVRSPAN